MPTPASPGGAENAEYVETCHKAALDAEDGPKEATLPASAVMSAGYNTRASRMASGQRLLAADSAKDVTVQVLTENDFAFIFRGVGNRYVSGVKATVKDLNGKAVKTLTSDDEFGAVVFNANDFVCDYDKEMELSITVEAEAYDKAMKKYQHESSLAKQKQKLGTAKEYYKSVMSGKGQVRMKFDFGYFLMLSGRAEQDDNGGIDWTVSGAGGGNLLFSFDYTQQMSLGPVPFYVNINFSASAGVCLEGLYFSFTYDYDGYFHGMEWWIVRGVTIDIRLALTVTLGIGVKGICSVWVSATGALNIILTFMNGLPMHVAVYAEIIISVGFEIFWIKYSKAVSDIPKWKNWSNYNLDTPEKKAFALFTALADTPEPDEAALTPLEPERYPQLTPVAEKVMENEGNSRSGIKVIEHNGETYIFYLTQSPTKGSDGKNHRRIGWLNTKTGEKGDIQPILNGIRYSLGTNVSKDKDDYAFDVKSNDGVFAIVACCASQFAEKGEPVESNINNKNIYYYMLALEADAQGNLVISDVKQYFTEEHLYGRSLYPILNAPQIEGMSVKTVGYYKRVELYGAFQNYSSSRPENTGYVPFYMKAQSAATLSLRGASGIKSGMGDDYIRVGLRTGAIAEGNYWDNSFYYLSASSSWVALSKKGDPLSEDGAIEMYDWDMNIAPEGQRRSVVLAQGDIGAFAVLQSLNQEGTGYSQTIFYTQNETLEDRTDKRLKGIYIAPKQGGGTRNIRFDMTYTDCDLNIPATDFRAVTLGTSQYLYWLSTVTKEKESDPDVWRITGVYYDSATNSISDQIVIAEFILPDSQWNGTTYRSVPFEIMLTEKGTGYIAAKPDTENEDDHAIAPLTLRKVKMKWNGRRTRCVIADAVGTTVISDEAVLTVTELPDTGDHTHLPLYLAVALIAAAILIILRRKERDRA